MNMEAKSRVGYALELEVIRGDGRREPVGTVGNTTWRSRSPRHWPATFRIWRINRRNRSYLKARADG